MTRMRSPEARARRLKKWHAQKTQRREEALATRGLLVAAAERRVVRLPDGRTGRLLSVPAQSSHASSGVKARVELPSGAVVSVPLSELVVEA